MSKIKLLIDSGCDATKEQLREIDTELVPLVITMGEEHVDDFYDIDHVEAIILMTKCGDKAKNEG